MTEKLTRSLHLALGCIAAFGDAVAADWPQHLGPHRSGVADASEAALPDVFDQDAKPLWKADLGTGFAGPVVVGERVLIFHREGDEALIDALDRATGERIWRYTFETDYVDSFGFDDGPRAVPTVHDDRVIVHGADGRVHAVRLEDGTKIWSFDTVAEFGSPQGYFGRAGAPLIVGDAAIITAGGTRLGKPAGLVALNVTDGTVKWFGVGDEAGYSAPVVDEHGHIIAWMRNQLWVVDAATGDVLDSVRFRSDMDASVNACTPLVLKGNRVFVSAGYGVGAGLWDVSEDGKLREVWHRDDWMDCHYGTPVEYEGCLYGFDGRQETGQTLRCVDLESGEVRWNSAKLPGGNLLRVADKLVVVTEQGELWILRASPERFETLHTQQIFRAGHRSHPAYSDGVLFARDGEKLVAVKLH